MPNWATTTVRFSGSAETITKIREAVDVDSKTVDFDVWLPTPEELTKRPSPLYIEKDERALAAYLEARNEDPATSQHVSAAEAQRLQDTYGAADWYDWRVSNWGTKWDGCLLEVSTDEPQTIVLHMDTAWSEPAALFEFLDNKFPDLGILAGTIYEDGSEFAVSYGDTAEFLGVFTVNETIEREDTLDDETVECVTRSIELR